MKKHVLLFSILGLITACSGLPKVHPHKTTPPAKLQRDCGQLFPQGKWQFVHSIEAAMPEGQKGMLLGVTRISSVDQTIQTVIMTIEGMVLFDARYDRQLVINRSVRPFDSGDMAGGLIKDIQLIFFRPPGPLVASGTLANGTAACRYQNPGQQVLDIIKHSDHRWELQLYNQGHKKIRTVEMFFSSDEIKPAPLHVPNRLKLTFHGYPGYTLDMSLLEAITLSP
ncbi:MAG: hypothetical protein Q8P24_09740 [Desulfobacterales bacterium]|nr:hypothetical protein [Desulfobacterales bacterium]